MEEKTEEEIHPSINDLEERVAHSESEAFKIDKTGTESNNNADYLFLENSNDVEDGEISDVSLESMSSESSASTSSCESEEDPTDTAAPVVETKLRDELLEFYGIKEPKVELLVTTADNSEEKTLIGCVSSISKDYILIKSNLKNQVLALETVLYSDLGPIGKVVDVIGNVDMHYYVVLQEPRDYPAGQGDDSGNVVGETVQQDEPDNNGEIEKTSAPNHLELSPSINDAIFCYASGNLLRINQLNSKGTDASTINDMELSEEVDFSDDEKEREHKKRKKNRNKVNDHSNASYSPRDINNEKTLSGETTRRMEFKSNLKNQHSQEHRSAINSSSSMSNSNVQGGGMNPAVNLYNQNSILANAMQNPYLNQFQMISQFNQMQQLAQLHHTTQAQNTYNFMSLGNMNPQFANNQAAQRLIADLLAQMYANSNPGAPP
jgi:rRNA processing protein Gar1